ncbi:TetR/AcrR family transcriptional regulator [Roseovarius spongiae]|uniref:TetR/AcrR family transcriptional regulator n=1 Tax=Roseovarius spongiae TaxID=2320272 RepID=UPI00140DE239|nr:TetR family transcriptional regulator C-terminal domain-containing protein [Roseovarius spongiae]
MPEISPTRQATRPRTHAEINEFRRKSFVEGALRSLAEKGVSGTTVSTICKAAGSSRGLLGHYFQSKDDVMVAALEHLFGGISESVQRALDACDGPAADKLLSMPAALFAAPAFSDLNRTAFLALWHETRFNPRVRAANRQLYRGYIARTERLVAAAAAETGAEIDARQVALGFIALSDGLWLGLSIHDDVMTGEQAIGMCRDYLRRELRIE